MMDRGIGELEIFIQVSGMRREPKGNFMTHLLNYLTEVYQYLQ